MDCRACRAGIGERKTDRQQVVSLATRDEGVLLAPQPVRTSRNDPAYALSSSAAGCRGCDESVTFARVLDGYCDTCAEEVLFLRNRALEDRRMPLPPLAKLREHFLPRRRPPL